MLKWIKKLIFNVGFKKKWKLFPKKEDLLNILSLLSKKSKSILKNCIDLVVPFAETNSRIKKLCIAILRIFIIQILFPALVVIKATNLSEN